MPTDYFRVPKTKSKNIDPNDIHMDCFAYNNGKCSALTFLYCGFDGGECSFYKPKHLVPMRGTGRTCEYCGLPFIPPKYSKRDIRYCSKNCAYRARQKKKKEEQLEQQAERSAW